MTLLDRYLNAIAEALPKDVAADDVVAEIGDDLRSQIEDREARDGRALRDAEIAEIIQAYGHPRVVASRYGRVPYLIGPELLPFYWSTLQLIATLVVAAELLAGGISAIVTGDGSRFFDALGAAWNSAIWIFGIVTIAFAVSERVPQNRARIDALTRWNPLALAAPGAVPRASRTSALAEFVANTLALLVLLDAPGPHRIPLDRLFATMLHDLHVALTPAWHAALVGTASGTALLALSSLALFVRPSLSPVHEAIRALASAFTIAGLAFTLASGPLLQPAGGLPSAVALTTVCAAITLLLVQIGVSLRALLRRRPPTLLHEAPR